ncbi:hypothetical protein [Methanolobus halotolerans]|uniref:Uncharacterized protein n=1 Tax=Methanolobus halotolerans TaxID=2052935 RepID=A0A4E0Q2E3_9EURY|nr:hypothetical protein [Methanolobus halotolerans]TGC06962.1 hypothetical protein CUN85_12180 [Methanolobus halotolerans]
MAYEVYPIYDLEIEFNSIGIKLDETVAFKNKVNKIVYVDIGIILVYIEEPTVRHVFIPLSTISKISYRTQNTT